MPQTTVQIVSTQPCPQRWGSRFPFFGQAGRHSLPHGWLCSSQKRGTSSQILVRRHTQIKHTTAIWICNLCHKQIKKQQTSIRYNHTHNTRWVDLKCTQIKQRQYKPDWRCTIHTHTQIATTPSTDNTTYRRQNTTQPHTDNNQPKDKNIIILQVNIHGIRNKIEELKTSYTATNRTSSQYKKQNSHRKLKYSTTPPIRTDRDHKQGGGLITLIKDDITFTNINIPKAINTHNTEQLIKIHIGKTKHITVGNTYFPPRDTASPHYNTVDTDIAYCIRHVTNIPDSILTCDVNAHSTLWYSHTDDHRAQLISDIISNSEHIIKHRHTHQSPAHNTIADRLPIITTINTRTKYKLQQSRHTFTDYRKANWTQFTTDTEAAFSDIQPPPDIHTANTIFTNILLHADKHNIPRSQS